MTKKAAKQVATPANPPDRKLYRVALVVQASAYVKATSPEHARRLVTKGLLGDTFDIKTYDGSDDLICGLPFDHPHLPAVSLSPAMTIHCIDDGDDAAVILAD